MPLAQPQPNVQAAAGDLQVGDLSLDNLCQGSSTCTVMTVLLLVLCPLIFLATEFVLEVSSQCSATMNCSLLQG